MVLIAPAIVPLYNSAIRLFFYNRTNGDLLTYHQHYVDIDEANSRRRAGGSLRLLMEYSPLYAPDSDSPEASKGYGLRDLSYASWAWLNSTMQETGTPQGNMLKALYEKFRVVSYPIHQNKKGTFRNGQQQPSHQVDIKCPFDERLSASQTTTNAQLTRRKQQQERSCTCSIWDV